MGLNDIKNSPALMIVYTMLGAHYSVEQTFKQANQTLKSLEIHQEALASHGFIAKDQQTLLEARDALMVAKTDRTQVREQRKGLTQEQQFLVRDGHTARTFSRTTLEGVYEDLQLSQPPHDEGEDIREDVAAVRVSLESTRKRPGKATALRGQLETLRDVLRRERVNALAKARTMDNLDVKLSAHVEKMRAMQQNRATPRGTPEQTTHLHLLNGLIVTLARRALKAAKAAAQATGNTALVQVFALGYLH